ncbi:MAG: hypothetical protein A3B68_06995 [Candidatus Melainabacteria bacterium RIFCSPHIGHO2_02_FULL_34_12]|nr:MAG: hypothetical protein A3B68_06995 [Candidatus Melainabacteria bacterium RIFCSPHIGHO2_02_FULL_34_12]
MTNQPNTYGPAVAGMLHKLKMIQAISNNISNINSIGYKRQIPESISFESVLSETALKDDTSGALTRTGNKFDLALEGNAYFLIESENGPVPTKDGRFRLNEKGKLCTPDGKELVVVEKTDKPISLARETDININQKGEIFIGTERYGRIAIKVMDNNPVRVHQSYLEGSNVSLMNEMISLAMAFRSFEASEKMLGLESSADRDLIEKYGRNV